MKFNAFLGKAILFALAASSTALASAQDFTVSILSSNNVNSVEEDGIAGDDRGGIALSPTRVFYTGDDFTVSLGLSALDIVNTGEQLDALFSDLSNGTVYSFGDAGGPAQYSCCGFDSRTIDRLYVIDGSTGVPTGATVALSQTFSLNGDYGSGGTGIFAGMGFVVVHDGTTAWKIALPSGTVTSLGAMSPPTHEACESWAYWGVAENVGSQIFLDTASDPNIYRTSVPDGAQSVLANFPDGLSDMCSFSVAPNLNRWYFHAEGGGFFPCCEIVGYADAYFNLQSDFGDAPDTYGTTLANDGARHVITGSGPILGTLIDGEADGQPSVNADGDDQHGSRDEDGVAVLLHASGSVDTATVTVSGADGLLDAWIDFNQDGDFTDAGEQIFVSQPVTVGKQTLTFAVPVTAGTLSGKYYARFRISSAGGLGPTGSAPDGEVEDYVVRAIGGGGSTPPPGGGGGAPPPSNGNNQIVVSTGGGAIPLASLLALFGALALRRRRTN